MGVRVAVDKANVITDARISMGPVGPVPHLAEPAMDVLVGSQATASQYKKAAELTLQNVELRASKYRATREYRERLVRTFLPAILERAVERAKRSAS